MNEKQYVNAIVRKIKCGAMKRKDIKKQLLGEIYERREQGEEMTAIMERMGSPGEIAGGYNENMSDAEKKRYTINKILKILILVVLLGSIAAGAIRWAIPRQKDIAQSTVFNQDEVEEAMKRVVALLDSDDYETLKKEAIPEMQQVLTETGIGQAKKSLAKDWGERLQFGKIYTTELTQKNIHYAVGEITVGYENISVTYRITFNSEMLLAGLYIR